MNVIRWDSHTTYILYSVGNAIRYCKSIEASDIYPESSTQIYRGYLYSLVSNNRQVCILYDVCCKQDCCLRLILPLIYFFYYGVWSTLYTDSQCNAGILLRSQRSTEYTDLDPNATTPL